MKYISKNWREIATIHYSTLAFYAICALILIPEIIFLMTGMDLNPVVLGRWLIASALFGLIGKFLIQTKEERWVRRVAIGVVLILSIWASVPALAKPTTSEFDNQAFSLISKWEGKRNESYQDIVGVWTICYGHTKTARPHQYKTDAQCRDLLIEEIAEYRKGLHDYFTATTIYARLPVHRDVAYTSLAYNVGIRAAGRSTATRRLNKGDIAGGCEALTWWNRAGGRIVRGLVRRRNEERQYCLRGVVI